MSAYPLLSGLEALVPRYQAFIIDLFGVLHDGVSVYPKALDCVKRLKAVGKTVIILSNAPRRSEAVTKRNSELGIPATLVDRVMSSGEATWQILAHPEAQDFSRGWRRCFHLGPDRDVGMRAGLPYEFVADPRDSDFVLLTGPTGFDSDVTPYRAQLAALREANLPMVCANPDKVVIRSNKREICAGALAEAYAAMGGVVRLYGKPDPKIYDACLAPFPRLPRSAVLAIGDSLTTDIAGAMGAGIDALFVSGGIHADSIGQAAHDTMPDPRRLAALIESAPAQPLGVVSHLSW